MILIGAEHGITAIYGAIIIAGLFTFLIAPFFSRFIRFFPARCYGDHHYDYWDYPSACRCKLDGRRESKGA